MISFRRQLTGVAFAAGIAAAAHAQPPAQPPTGCGAFERLVGMLPDGLAPLHGALQGPGVWMANENLQDFEICIVAKRNGISAYTCRATFPANADGRARYDAMASELRACFPRWNEQAVTKGDNRADVVVGMRLWRRDATGDAVVGVSLLRDRSTGRRRLGFAIGDRLPDEVRAELD